MKFLSTEIGLYLHKYVIRSCMKYQFYVWASARSYYLEMLDELQKPICRTVDRSLATTVKPLAHPRNIAGLSIFYRHYFGRCSSETAQLVFHFLILVAGLLVILIDYMIFLSLFLDGLKISMSAVSFLLQLGSGNICL